MSKLTIEQRPKDRDERELIRLCREGEKWLAEMKQLTPAERAGAAGEALAKRHRELTVQLNALGERILRTGFEMWM